MNTHSHLIISRYDFERLQSLLATEFAAAFSDKSYLQALRDELNRATILDPKDIPPDVVTMNSTVRLRDVLSQEDETYTLVFPEDANIASGRLSVLAPVGTAILGYRVGDLVRWQGPRWPIRLRIEELTFQPEREGVAA